VVNDREYVAPGRRPSRQVRRRRTIAVAVGIPLLTAGALTGLSVGSALNVPGDDTTATKLAEWARDHGLGAAVTAMEEIQYRLNPPRTGGAPDGTLLAGPAGVAQLGSGHGIINQASLRPSVAMQPRISTPVTPALTGEGVYRPVYYVNGSPLVQVTYVRPDAVHTSYLTGVVWMSRQLRFVLHPGFQDPGVTQAWSQPDKVAASQVPGLVATFNSGFKIKDAGGGFYLNGLSTGALQPGAASFVIYNDGHADIGTWNQEVNMTPGVAAVRQNLKLLIDNGQVAANLNGNVQSNWGATIGGGDAVWRSGIGVTASGDIVYAAGDALTVQSLAAVLQRAGAVRAMQLDINPAWISYMWYAHKGSGVTPLKLLPFQRPADRYLGPVSRDFFAVYAPTT